MNSTVMLLAKAMVVSTAVILAVDYLAPRLPDQLVVGGRDLRPYVAGGVVAGALMWAGRGGKLGPVGDVVKPA